MTTTITGRGFKVSDSIREKVFDLLSKHKRMIPKNAKVMVEIKSYPARTGKNENLAVEITLSMPKAMIRVEQVGGDFYSIIDQIDPIFKRRLTRYKDHKKKWEGGESWKDIESRRLQEESGKSDKDNYLDYKAKPYITRHKKYSQNSPMHPEEAIERMELLGHEAFLFKNIETDTYSMVYKKRDGSYGLVEPKVE